MANLKNRLIYYIFIFACLPLLCHAGELIVFDDPGLVVLRSEKTIHGYYSAYDGKYSCDFFITKSLNEKNNLKSVKNNVMGIKTFFLSVGNGELGYNQRETDSDVDGSIYFNDDEWTIQTNTNIPACDAFGFSRKKPGDEFYKKFVKMNTFPAIKIMVVLRKTHLYDKKNGGYAKRRGYLTQADIVALQKKEGKFSKILYVDPGLGKITIDWIRSDDLVDPFPPS